MNPVRSLVPTYLVLCIVFGGASAAGYLANAGLQLIAVGLLTYAAAAAPDGTTARSDRNLQWLLAGVLLVVAVQFIPLPTGLWLELPGRADVLAPLAEVGIPFSHGFVSLIPHESLKSAVWLLPAIALLVAIVRRPALYSGRRIAVALVAAMCAAVLIGAMQRASGGGSALYFYHFTNRGSAVGFFANANHMASLLLVTIPFQAALLQEALKRRETARLAGVAAVAASLGLTGTGIFVVGSLAGYGMLPLVAGASALIVIGGQRTRITVAATLALAVAAGLAFVLMTGEGQALLDRGSGMSEGSREVIFGRTWSALRDFWPMGSGLGTFAEVYPSYEDPLTVTRTFINHAHNDYLELVLETGVVGLALLPAFLSWWGVRAWRIWTEGASPFAKAAVIASAVLLVHSSVDYPLRTAALSTIFATCVALMAAQRSTDRMLERKGWADLK